MKERIGKIDFTVFDYFVQIVVTDDIIASRKQRSYMIGHKFNDNGGLVVGLHSCNDGCANSYLFFTEKATAGIIAHECYHSICRMFKWISAETEEEITAYYLGYLVDEVTKFINEKPAVKTKKK